jgi:hypothetical protein
MNEEKKGPSPKELAIIAGAILAVVIAAIVIAKTVNANRVHDVIVIKGAKGAKPMPGDKEYTESSSGLSGASDRPLQADKNGNLINPPAGGNAQPVGAKGQ